MATRLGAALGLAAAAVLVVNALKLGGVLPTTTATQLLAPTGQAMAVIFVLGLAWRALPATWWAIGATALNVLGLTFGVGVEYVLNFVLRVLPPDARESLLAGTLGTALLATSVVFALGSVAFAVALLRAGTAPRVVVVGYAVAAVVVALRALVPAGVFLGGLAGLVVCVVILSVWMTRRRRAA